MRADHIFAGIPVADYAAARPWYERLAGRAPDMVPHDHEAVWQLTDTGWLYIVEDAERAGRALVTLLVDDIDAVVAGLAGRGIGVPPIGALAGVRVTTVTDPDGNRIQFGQPRAPGEDAA